MLKFAFALIAVFLIAANPARAAHVSRVLKFNGIPPNIAGQIKRKFPFVLEREVTLAEIDEIVRFLMKTGTFSNVEAVERDIENGTARETAIVASILRRINNIKIKGNQALPSMEILRILSIEKGQVFERKHLLAAAEDLRKLYENMGYHNARVEIDFELPNESEVAIDVAVNEGKPVRISDVVIDSPNAELAAALTRISKSLKGKIYTEDETAEFQNRASNYLTKNRYLTARLSPPSTAFSPDRLQAKLSYVVENPYKFDFRFEGNSYFADSTLIRLLEEERLAGVNSSPAPDLAEKIRRRYLEAGFAHVEVTYGEKIDEANYQLMLRFAINEGPRVRIKRIEVTGGISRPETYYASFIKTSSSDIVGKGYYNRKDVEDSTKRLVTELQNQGYLRARIQSSRAEFSADKSSVTVTLSVDEGPLTQIRQIRFEGVESFPKPQLTEILKIRTGSALGLRELEESISALKTFYRSEGFLEMRILNENEQNRIVTYNEGSTQATVEFQIYEGPRVRVGSITIQGNSFTKDIVILRELAFKQGDVLTPEKIDESVFRLQKLSLFSRVGLRTLEEGTNIAERTVIIEIAEKDPGIGRVRIGATNERQFLTLRGAAGVDYSNINGTGRGVTFRVEPKYSLDPRVSYIENIITLSYREPYIFGDRNRGRVSLTREQSLFEIRDSEVTIQESNTIGFLLERDLTRFIRLSYNMYSLSNQRKFDRVTFTTKENLFIGKTGPMVEFDFRDDVFNPSRGTYSYLNLEYADPWLGSSKDETQTINFVKVTSAFTIYNRIWGRKDLVLVNQLRGGYLANVSSESNGSVPVQEAFFLGGRSTIRGFSGTEDEHIPNRWDLFPSAQAGDDPELARFRVRSDSYFGLFKTELWFPIYGSLGGTVFYDGGAVFVNNPNIVNPDPYRDSAGFGIRFITPVGPANVEFGWKLDRRRLREGLNGGYDVVESPWAVHISIGAL